MDRTNDTTQDAPTASAILGYSYTVLSPAQSLSSWDAKSYKGYVEDTEDTDTSFYKPKSSIDQGKGTLLS